MSILTKIKNAFGISKYDVEKDKEMELKDKIFVITNETNFKISKIETRSKQKVEKLKNSMTTKLDKLNRKLTRIRMTKFNEARYICEDSCILDTLEDIDLEEEIRIEKPEQENTTKTTKKTKKETK